MKSYKQFCGVAKALDLVGERWTLLIVRDLLLGPRRFTDLQQGLAGLTPNLLSTRLGDLVEAGIVEQVAEPRRSYQLTEQGRTLEPAVPALGRFGAGYMNKPKGDERVNARWAMVSLKRKYLGCTVPGTATLQLGGDSFYLSFGGPQLQVPDSSPDQQSDLVLRGELPHWFLLLTRRKGLAELEALGVIQRQGNARTARAFIKSLGMLA